MSFNHLPTQHLADILSEARKYKLNLVLAHQYIGQLYSDDGGGSGGNMIRDAVFGNVGTFIAFRVGPVDAEIISKQFAPYITEEDLVSLPRRHMYLTLNVDGAGSAPFSARTSDIPEKPPVTFADHVIKQSGEQYGIDRNIVETSIKEDLEKDWINQKEMHQKESAAGQKKNNFKNKKKNFKEPKEREKNKFIN